MAERTEAETTELLTDLVPRLLSTYAKIIVLWGQD